MWLVQILIVHNHDQYVDIYGFDKESWHFNACTMDAGTVYEHPVTHSTAIIMINQAIKIDIMTNILVCPMQCQVHGTVVNKCPKFLPPLPSQDNHTLLVHDPVSFGPSLIIPLSLDGVTNYFKA